MRILGYSGYRRHRAEHARLVSDAQDMLRNLEVAFGRDDWPAIVAFFRHWMIKHTAGLDRDLEDFILELQSGEHATAC